MSEPESWLSNHWGELVAWVGSLGGAMEYFRRRIDQVADTQAQFVTREELQEIISAEREDINRKHQQNLDAFDNLTKRIDRVLERL